MEVSIILPKLFPRQQEIVDHPARFKVLACGRRFGKTRIAVHLLMKKLLSGQKVAYFAPSYRMASEVWREIKATLHSVMTYFSEKDFYLTLLTGGELEIWSGSDGGDLARGRKYHYAVIDEAALIANENMWNAVIRPLLVDYKGGALFASTPRGLNWFYTLYGFGQDEIQTDWKSWRLPTVENPYLDIREIEDAQRHTPQRTFAQEFEATFLRGHLKSLLCHTTPLPASGERE